MKRKEILNLGRGFKVVRINDSEYVKEFPDQLKVVWRRTE